MSLVQTIDQIEYPESDGKPIGETDVHIDWMIRAENSQTVSEHATVSFISLASNQPWPRA